MLVSKTKTNNGEDRERKGNSNNKITKYNNQILDKKLMNY